jgi:hypothetical protein
MDSYVKLVGRNYVNFKDVLEMRDIVSRSNAEGYYCRVVSFDNGSGTVEYWK